MFILNEVNRIKK